MIRGLYTSAQGMYKSQKQLDVVSNNLANTATVGYKKDFTSVQSFKEIFITKTKDTENSYIKAQTGNMRLGADVAEIYTDFSAGAIINTGKNMDVAISGSGSSFFTVQDQNGDIFYTRNGEFHVNLNGDLMMGEYYVMGQNGRINIQNFFESDFSVDASGDIRNGDDLVGRLLISDFGEDVRQLKKTGDNLFRAENINPTPAVNAQINQGFLENSNTNTVREMVEMLSLYRAYEANSKVLKTHDDLLAKAVNEVGKG